jgi:cobalamin biosynthesis protein CobD/CbiB
MKKSTKSVLLSALIFPGVGHLFLKQYLRGIALLVMAMSGVTIIVVKSVQHALPIVEKIQNGDVPLEAQALSNLVSKSLSGPDGLLVNLVSLAILLCWVIGIVDSYRIGHRQDRIKVSNHS